MKKNKLIQKNINIIFIGGNTFGQDNPFLSFAKICQNNNIDFTLITSKKRANYPTSNGNSLKKELINKNYNFHIKNKIELNFLKKICNKNSILFSLSSMFIIPSNVIDHFKKKIFNYHNISVKNFRGAGCHSWRIMQNVNKTTINIHKLTNVIDDGNIVSQLEVKFPKNIYNLEQTYRYLKKYESKLFNRFLFNKHTNIVQSSENFYWGGLKTLRDAYIDWNWDSNEILSFCNAFDKPFEGASTYYMNIIVQFKNVTIYKKNIYFHPFQYGTLVRHNKQGYFIASKNGLILVKNIISNKKIFFSLGKKFTTRKIKNNKKYERKS